jgi:hypothetical protein
MTLSSIVIAMSTQIEEAILKKQEIASNNAIGLGRITALP